MGVSVQVLIRDIRMCLDYKAFNVIVYFRIPPLRIQSSVQGLVSDKMSVCLESAVSCSAPGRCSGAERTALTSAQHQEQGRDSY